MAVITAPNGEYSGVVAGVRFVDGKGESEDSQALIYFRRHGYTVQSAAASGPFDPGAHTAPEVLTYLAEANEDERERVLAAERDGKNRKGIVGDGPPSEDPAAASNQQQ